MATQTIISLQEVRDWCRIDGTADDALLSLLILTAQEAAEKFTGLTLSPMSCPQAVRQAVAVFAADLYANREGQTVGTQTFERLLAPYRGVML